MVATAGFRSRLVQQDSSGKLLDHKHKRHSNGRNVLLDNLMRRAAQTLWPARTANKTNKKGKSTSPGQQSDSLRSQSRDAVPTLHSDSDRSMGRFSASRSTPTATQRVLPEWLMDTMSAMPPQDPLHKLSNSRSLSINQTDSNPAEATVLNGPTHSEDSFTVFPESSPSPPSPIFKSKPLYSSVELHHPTPIKRVVTPYIFDERSTYQNESIAGLDDRIVHDQKANANDSGTRPKPEVDFPLELIMWYGSDLEGLSTLGDLTASHNPPTSMYGIGADSDIFQAASSAGSAQLDASLNFLHSFRHTRHLSYPSDDISLRLRRELVQATTHSPKQPANPEQLELEKRYERPLQRHFQFNSRDPVSEVLSREHRSFISPFLGMTAVDHDLETKKVQLLSPVTPPSGSETKRANNPADHLSAWGVPFSSIKSSAPSSGHFPPSPRVITDTFNRKLMKHASVNYPAPLPALNFVDALLRRHRDNKYVPRGHSKFHPQLHKPELTDDSSREGIVFPANQTSELYNLVISSGGCSTDARMADSYARGAFTPNWPNCDAASESEPWVISGGCEASNTIQYHEGVPLDKSLALEANRGSQPSLANAAQSILHMSRHQYSNHPRDNCTPVRGAPESWPGHNDNSSSHASLGNLTLRSDVKNTACYPRTPPSKFSPLGNIDASLNVKNVASYPRTPPTQLAGQVDRNSGTIEYALPPILEQSTCVQTGDGVHTRIATDRAMVSASGSIVREECVHPEDPIPQQDSPGEFDGMMHEPEDLPFSEMVDEDNEEWVTLYQHGVATDGVDAHTDPTRALHSHHEGGGSSSVASSMLAENDDVLEWSENEGPSRGGSHDSIESWSNADVLSFLKGQLRSEQQGTATAP